tara:strand:- start:95 stop:226 length:132 start_codon:yes stop_codon:yes gene_type:complete
MLETMKVDDDVGATTANTDRILVNEAVVVELVQADPAVVFVPT